MIASQNQTDSRFCFEKKPACRGKLVDSIVNFGEHLPERDLSAATLHSERADLTLVLGSSMRVSPACDLPALSYSNGGIFCICNLQRTPFDGFIGQSGGIRIFAKTDQFFRLLMKELGIEVPEFRVDTDQIKTELENLIYDDIADDENSCMKKYNVRTMADDGPPPEAILEMIRDGFVFRRHVVPVEKQAPLSMLAQENTQGV